VSIDADAKGDRKRTDASGTLSSGAAVGFRASSPVRRAFWSFANLPRVRIIEPVEAALFQVLVKAPSFHLLKRFGELFARERLIDKPFTAARRRERHRTVI